MYVYMYMYIYMNMSIHICIVHSVWKMFEELFLTASSLLQVSREGFSKTTYWSESTTSS